jgi:hypothetical protein
LPRPDKAPQSAIGVSEKKKKINLLAWGESNVLFFAELSWDLSTKVCSVILRYLEMIRPLLGPLITRKKQN